MQKHSLSTITVGYPWKSTGSPVAAVYNDPGEYKNMTRIGGVSESSEPSEPSEPSENTKKPPLLQTHQSHLSPNNTNNTNNNTTNSAGSGTNFTYENPPKTPPEILLQRLNSALSPLHASTPPINTPGSENSLNLTENGPSSDDGSGHIEDTRGSALGSAQRPLSDPNSSPNGPKNVYPNRRPKALSGTKRAAQNRSAQKAFRERKEKYIKDLEATALQVPELQQTIEKLRQENAQLRQYNSSLQDRLMQLTPTDPDSI